MSRIDELRTELARLEHLQRRADKLRGKRGYLEVSQETLTEYEALLGRDIPHELKPDQVTVKIDFETLVQLIDQKLAE